MAHIVMSIPWSYGVYQGEARWPRKKFVRLRRSVGLTQDQARNVLRQKIPESTQKYMALEQLFLEHDITSITVRTLAGVDSTAKLSVEFCSRRLGIMDREKRRNLTRAQIDEHYHRYHVQISSPSPRGCDPMELPSNPVVAPADLHVPTQTAPMPNPPFVRYIRLNTSDASSIDGKAISDIGLTPAVLDVGALIIPPGPDPSESDSVQVEDAGVEVLKEQADDTER